jgi:hypothetical protein
MDTADAYVESGHPGRLSIDDELELVGLRLSPPLLERIAAICELLHSALFGRKATPARTAYRAEQSTLAAILFNRLGRRDFKPNARRSAQPNRKCERFSIPCLRCDLSQIARLLAKAHLALGRSTGDAISPMTLNVNGQHERGESYRRILVTEGIRRQRFELAI